MLAEPKIDAFICVHRRDVDYLLELVLRSYQVNFLPKNRLIFVTNDLPYLQAFIEQLELDVEVILTSDSDWLSSHELELPGWYRQQVIKLRAYEFCETANFCNLGADTIMLQPLRYDDLVCGDIPILHYTRHLLPDIHFLFERKRVRHVANILKVKPQRARQYVDFINDLFCFSRVFLIELTHYLRELYGKEQYYHLLCGLNTTSDQNKFGEWTLYSVFLLDYLMLNVPLRDTRSGFLSQVHSRRLLSRYRFDTQVVHFVAKDFSPEYIRERIRQRGLPLAKHL